MAAQATFTRLPNHIFRGDSAKTICVTAVITSLGIPANSFQSTWTRKNPDAYKGVIRRAGFAVRSRKSSVPRIATMGAVRAAIRKMGDPAGTVYMIRVPMYLILLNDKGETIVDTDPRKIDRRAVLDISAVWKS